MSINLIVGETKDMKKEIEVVLATESTQFESAKALILEYVAWLGIDLSFQNFEDEMNDLSKMYSAPQGGLLLAMVDGHVAGVAGVRKFSGSDCELKRMYVDPQFRNIGAGQVLLSSCINLARTLGYHSMKLDTADFMKAAITLYKANGFVEIAQYRPNPHPEAKYFELTL